MDEEPPDQASLDLKEGRVDKRKIARLIFGADKTSQRRRALFLSQFQFRPPLIEALRQFLSAFHLSGETQQQDRILYAFAERYIACTSEFTLEIAYQVVYSIILLNTDLHNKIDVNTKRMSNQEYIDNTRSALMESIGTTVDDELQTRVQSEAFADILTSIYESVKRKPIMQPQTDGTESVSDHRSSRSESQSYMESRSDTSKIHLCMSPPPFKSGFLLRKQVLETRDRRASDRKWLECFCRVVGSDLLIFSALDTTRFDFHIPLRHAVAMGLADRTYSVDHPYVFQLLTYTGALYLFDCPSTRSASEWAQCLNYWSAIESREPLTSGIGVWYGIEKEWLLDFVANGSAEQNPGETEHTSPRDFSAVSLTSVGLYHTPLLPFIPASLAGILEEVTLNQRPQQKNIHGSRHHQARKPLGLEPTNLMDRRLKYDSWERRVRELAVDLAKLIYVREILRCLGVGRGVIDATAYDSSVPTIPLESGSSESIYEFFLLLTV